MTDSLYVAGTVAFFALMLAFAAGVARLSDRPSDGNPHNDNESR